MPVDLQNGARFYVFVEPVHPGNHARIHLYGVPHILARRYPLKIAHLVVLLVPIFMVYLFLVGRPWYKCLGDKNVYPDMALPGFILEDYGKIVSFRVFD
jgi:hypothetical protein